MRFEDFVLQFDSSPRGGFRARVLKSPFGEGVVGFSLPALAGVAAPFSSSGISRNLSCEEAPSPLGARPPLEIGTELFRSVFQGQVRSLLDKSLGQLEMSPSLGLRLKIKLDPSDEETGGLADLPWELLCDGETEDFFALSRQTSLVRYLDVPRSSQPIPFTPPLRILAVAATPHGMDPLNLEEESRRLETLNQSSSGVVQVRFLGHASVGAVREALSGDSYNVLHFMGHGTFDSGSGEGMLAFEGADGSPELVSGKAFATKLRDSRSLGVVVLNACDTARARHKGGANPFRGVATALVYGGVPAVVAMQQPISDLAAIGFSTAFYRNLAGGDSIDEALTEGRQAIHSARPEEFEWATPVLFLRMPDGNVFVAKPAERPAPAAPPVVAPVAPALPPPAPARVSPGRGPALKIAYGVGGAALVSFVLYSKVIAPAKEPPPVHNELSPAQSPLTDKPAPDGGGAPGLKARAGNAHPAVTSREQKSSGSKPQGLIVPQSSSPAPAPPQQQSPESSAPVEPLHASADISSLLGQVLSITRRDNDGLRVTVSFKNTGNHPLSAVLDEEGSILTDNLGERYLIMESDLPSTGSGRRVELAAGDTSRHYFDFQAPRLGSHKFLLVLEAQGGRLLKVAGSSMTLEGSSQ